MRRMLTAVDLPTAAAVMTAFEEGEGLVAGGIVARDRRGIGLDG
jgi:hypothetical protein